MVKYLEIMKCLWSLTPSNETITSKFFDFRVITSEAKRLDPHLQMWLINRVDHLQSHSKTTELKIPKSYHTSSSKFPINLNSLNKIIMYQYISKWVTCWKCEASWNEVWIINKMDPGIV